MAEDAELTAPFYKISSVAAGGKALAGVGHIKPTFQHVHLSAGVYTWIITRVKGKPGGVYHLSLKDSYHYTGVGEDGSIIATVEKKDNEEWHIRHWREHNAFSIELDPGFRPARAWTLSSDTPDARIVLGNYELRPRVTQLFKIEKE